MKLESKISERINILRFPLIIGVLFIHAYNSVVGFADGEIGLRSVGFVTAFIRNYISGVLATISVPLFFSISGYLFFCEFKWSIKNYLRKIKSRVNTLIVPLLFWNSLVLITIALAQAIPSTAVFFTGKIGSISSFGTFDYLDAILGLTRRPIAYQFWFIRDLIALVALAPLINLILSRFSYTVILMISLFSAWLLNFWPLYFPYINSTFFFCIGAFLGYNQYNLIKIDASGTPLAITYFAISLADVLTMAYWFNIIIHKIGLVMGVGCAFHFTKYIEHSDRCKKLFLKLAPASFFVFAAHEPLLMVIKKLSYKTLNPTSDMGVISLYFVIPMIVTTVCLTGYNILRKLSPGFTKIVSGGR